GLPYESTGARQMRQLRSLGVKTVLQIPITGSGTEGAGQALPTWSSQNSIRSMIFVAARDHTRRVRRVLDRNMKGHPTRIAIRPSRYSNFNPDRWWETRRDFRTAVFELQKLALDFVLHPMQ